jgi:dipeptidyl aminopeptidase/acylaminoacyl peptidase
MNGSMPDLDRRLQGFFDTASAAALPDGLLEDTYRVTRRIPQRRGPVARRLATLRIWWSTPFGTATAARTVALAALLIVALAAALVLIAGSQRRLPPPYGLARNGIVVYDFDKRLYTLDDDGTSRLLEIGLGHNTGPVFSPDGTRFAFLSQAADRTPTRLFVADADGTNARVISGDVPMVGPATLSWSPDSTRIAFASQPAGRHSALYVAAADGSGVSRISEDDGGDRMFPAWSPHGDLIAYRLVPSVQTDVELAVMSPDGEGERPLVTAPLSVGAFAGSQWSPDGTRMAYFYRTLSEYDVVEIVDLDGVVQRVSRSDEDAFNPAWSNDGRRIAYALRAGETVIADLETDTRTTLRAELAGCGVLWSPDDRYMVGLGLDCRTVVRFPVGDSDAVEHVTTLDGEVWGVSIQRLAP